MSRTVIPLDYSPDHAAAIGRLLGHWAILESHLEFLLGMLLNIDLYRASFIYQEFVSTNSKIILLRRLNHFFVIDQELKNKLDKLLNQTRILNEKRNAFVHAIWASGPDNKINRMRTTMPGNHKKRFRASEEFTPQDIQNIVEEIAELSASLLQLITRNPITLTRQPQE